MSTFKPTWLFILLLIVTNVLGFTQFSNNGCDGGLCGLYLFIYSIPLTIGWLLSLFGMNLILKKKILYILIGIVLASISILIATLLLPLGNEVRMGGLKAPAFILISANVIEIVIALGTVGNSIKNKFNT